MPDIRMKDLVVLTLDDNLGLIDCVYCSSYWSRLLNKCDVDLILLPFLEPVSPSCKLLLYYGHGVQLVDAGFQH